MVSARKGSVSVHMGASPQNVWSLLASLERMGEWSPECYKVTWLDGASSPAKPGARFKGRNRWGVMRWTMNCEVKTVDPDKEISWSTVQGDRELVLWSYRMEPKDGGTLVTESFDVRWLPLMARVFEDFLMRDRDRRREQAMRATLQRIKETVEADS